MNKNLENIFDTTNSYNIDSIWTQFCAEDYKPKIIATGLDCLDEILDGGLPVGLTTIGALPSLGKTTLCLQLADNIAKNNNHVMYITIEQSTKELLAKSFSRLSFLHGEKLTAHDILAKPRTEFTDYEFAVLTNAVNEYRASINKHMHIVECKKQPTIKNISDIIHSFAGELGGSPVVFIDYLQLIVSACAGATDKQTTDNNISAFRQLAKELETPVVLISSLNRMNYNNVISLDGYKESGSIEYSSDVLLGLQPAGFSDIDVETKYKQKKNAKEKISNTMRDKERDLELIVLKNRNGYIPRTEKQLQFITPYSLFLEKQRSNIVY